MRQLITPNPNIKCYPGWCLMYVRQAFGLAGLYPSATAGWNAARFKHRDRNFPPGFGSRSGSSSTRNRWGTWL